MNFLESQKEVWKIFPTLISRYPNFLSNKQVEEIFDFCINYKKINRHGLLSENSFSSFDKTSSSSNILVEITNSLSSCRNLLDNLYFCLEEYEKEYGSLKLEIGNSWFNIQNEDSMLQLHKHGGSVISGVIYINSDSNSSKLFFENPNPFASLFGNAFMQSPTEYNCEGFWFEPQVGSLILFPSWLSHGNVLQKNMTKNRTVISFNTGIY